MKIKVLNFLKSHWSKIFPAFFFILLLSAYANIFAVFTPGQTLDPNCAPGAEGCIVEISGGSSDNPWLTGTSNIYHNGNVNVGSSTQPSLTSSIGVGDIIYSDVYSIANDSVVSADMDIDNNGNIIVAYQDRSALYLLICHNTDCSDNDTVTIDDEGFSGNAFRNVYVPIVKVDSNNTIHIVYRGLSSIKYATCTQAGVCNTTSIAGSYNFYSFDIGPNNIPQIIYEASTGSPDYIKYLVLARYTGTGEETTCSDNNWKCSEISSDDGYSFSWTIQLNSMYIDGTDGFPRFVASQVPSFGEHSGEVFPIDYFKCTSLDCATYEKESITNYTFNNNSEDGGLLPFYLSVDNNGNPVIIYTSSFYGGDLSLAMRVGDGGGFNCLDSDWSCLVISENLSSIIDFKIDSNNNPRILAYDRYIECNNNTCSDYTPASFDSGYSISLDSSNNLYILNNNGALSIKKKDVSSGVTFDSSGNDLYINGDSGISGNLFVDGSIVTSNGLYLPEITESLSSTTNALLNGNGLLYWNGSQLLTINDTVQNAYYAEHLSQTLGAYNGGTGLTSPGASGNVLTSNGSGGWVSQAPISSSPITIVNSSNLFSTGLGYSGSGVTAVTNSNFFGEYAGSVAINASYSNFLGYFAGYNAPSASYSNFLGHNAGYSATSASGSNFFGNSAGDSASSASNSNFFGTASGSGATNASYSNFFGFNAGNSASSASHSNFLGRNAGYLATNASYSNFFGYNAGQSASSASNSNFLGAVAGQSATNASNSNFLGVNAGQSATNASNSNFFGTNAGSHSPNAANSIFIGRDSGINSSINNTDTYNDLTTFANTSILIGHKTSTGNYSNSIAIGAYATNTATNQFMIGSTTRPINTTRFQGATTECTISTGTGIACTSDERLKTITSDLNIDPITKEEISVLDKLIKVKTVNFKWNDNPEGKNNIGFLAQDLYNYFPELINGDPENKEEYLSVYYSNMTPILVEAIREMNLKVGNLDTEIKKITINDLMSDFFGGAVDQVVEGVAYLKGLVVGEIKVGSQEKRTGITLYDEETGDPYCISIRGGQTITEEGECGVVEVPDICPNIEEYQQEIPDGYELDENNECIEVYIEEKSTDLELEKNIDFCLNIEGAQTDIPDGYELDENNECMKQEDLEILVDSSPLSTATSSQE